MATKNQKLRNNEYYNTQNMFDDLYSKSKDNHSFTNLLELITSEQNILLAYRTIKKNKGSKTSGTNNRNILNIGKNEPRSLIQYVRFRLSNFKPHSVKRVEIEKENGGIRPLGIPTIEDRLIQQCIKQILEPICEAKFYKHSYGFRPNRSTHHAIARVMYLTNQSKFQYVVDIDIKGFFDNVNHGKLLKQMWTMGICDKNLICVISKMLKAEIKGIGIPTKGVPQGGILSPLLSNIVLNELDWWIANQWENIKTKKNFKDVSGKYRALKRRNLKELFIVRYADDFKILCRNRKSANKIFYAIKDWLKERLGLEISPEKSKIVNLKRKYSEFLGIKLKLWEKGNKQVVKSCMTDKSIKKCKTKLREKIKNLQHNPVMQNVLAYNSTVLGLHNYYKIATFVNIDFHKIFFSVYKSLKCKTKNIINKTGYKDKAFVKYYGDYKSKTKYVCERALYPIHAIKNKPPMCFSQEICNYTVEGRNKIHDKLQKIDISILCYLMKNTVIGQSVEYNDNRISLYVGQQGKCAITKEKLEISKMETHHKLPKSQGGTDKYDNLVFVSDDIHKLIHATTDEIILKYLMLLDNVEINFDKLNELRVLVGNCEISKNK